MLVEPNLDVMLHDKRVGNKFVLVTLALKRARQLNDGSPVQVLTHSKKPVSIALQEINNHKIQVVVMPEVDPRFPNGRPDPNEPAVVAAVESLETE